MDNPFVAAVVQMNSGEDKDANLASAVALIGRAADAGAQLVALPETFNCLGRFEIMVGQAEPIPGPTTDVLSAVAAECGIVLIAGTICERGPTPNKAFNTCLVFGPDGELLARYRKIHLFDVDLPHGVRVEESAHIAAGEKVVVVDTPTARLGLSTCYDLRFAELYRALSAAGADVLLVPSAFTEVTGRDHWEVLLKARAIENQAFVIAPNQHGQHTPRLSTYGHSLLIDPWGNLLADAQAGEGIATATLDPARLREVRAQLPALEHRRDFLR